MVIEDGRELTQTALDRLLKAAAALHLPGLKIQSLHEFLRMRNGTKCACGIKRSSSIKRL